MRKKLLIKKNFLKLWGRLTDNIFYGDPEKYIVSSLSIKISQSIKRFYNSTLKYILFPSGIIILIHCFLLFLGSLDIDGSSSLFISAWIVPISIIMGVIVDTLEVIYEFLGIQGLNRNTDNCYHCLSSVLTSFALIAPAFLLIYTLWDIKKNNINLSFKSFKHLAKKKLPLIKETKVIKYQVYLLYLYQCIKQLLLLPVKKTLLALILPLFITILSGDQKYDFISFIDPYKYGLNPGGDALKKIITEEIINIYNNNYGSKKLEDKFGILREYISEEEWKNFKIPLIDGLWKSNIDKQAPYKPELFIPYHSYIYFHHNYRGVPYRSGEKTIYNKKEHMCKYNEGGIGNEELYFYVKNHHIGKNSNKEKFFYSKNSVDIDNLIKNGWHFSGEYRCPKYRYYITASELRDTFFTKLPTNKNIYFSNTMYIGIYDEVKNALGGKIFAIITEMVRNPCHYCSENALMTEYDKHEFECYKKLSDRKFLYTNLYIYNKNGTVIDNIIIPRTDE